MRTSQLAIAIATFTIGLASPAQAESQALPSAFNLAAPTIAQPNGASTMVVGFGRAASEKAALFDREAKANNVYPLINWSDPMPGFMAFQEKAGLWPAKPKD